MLPLIARNLLESVRLLASVARAFADKALAGMTANEETCRGYVEISPSMATALNPLIGYDRAAEIAKRSYRERRPVRDLAGEMTDLTAEQIEQALDPRRQTEPGIDPGGGGGSG
jgi:fumarate hydratase class II